MKKIMNCSNFLIAFLFLCCLSWVGRSQTCNNIYYEDEVSSYLRLLPKSSSNAAIDSIQMVLTWAPTFCTYTSTCRFSDQRFTLHGLWPADEDGETIPGVPNGPLINLSAQLQQQLAIYWPSNDNNCPNRNFWSHEWYAHGNVSNMQMAPYFQTGVTQMQFMNTVDLPRVLANAGFTPDNRRLYRLTDIVTTIAQRFNVDTGGKVYVSCRSYRQGTTTVYLLYEVYICLDPQGQNIIYCPQYFGGSRGCGGPDVILPATRNPTA